MAGFLFVALTWATFVVVGDVVQCPPGMFYSDCGTLCPKTCSDPDPFICAADCASGCFCDDSNPILLVNGSCGQLSDCSDTPVCPGDQIYSDCASACPQTCQSLNQPCQSCTPGCTCPSERPVLLNNGTCGLSEDCPPSCPSNQVYSDCALSCNRTCETPYPPCAAICHQGCTCTDPLPIILPNGTCVSVSDCESLTPTPSLPLLKTKCNTFHNKKPCRAHGCAWNARKRKCSHALKG